jgi:pentapeptide MXKDX repeat protein
MICEPEWRLSVDQVSLVTFGILGAKSCVEAEDAPPTHFPKEFFMNARIATLLIAGMTCGLAATTAFAQDAMQHQGSMAHSSTSAMSHDSMKQDSMKKDSMGHDSMKKDSMQHKSMQHKSMKHDSMKKDSMKHDSMMKNDGSMKADDGSMKSDSSGG